MKELMFESSQKKYKKEDFKEGLYLIIPIQNHQKKKNNACPGIEVGKQIKRREKKQSPA